MVDNTFNTHKTAPDKGMSVCPGDLASWQAGELASFRRTT